MLRSLFRRWLVVSSRDIANTIRAAYRALLQRDADEPGLEHYKKRIISGEMSLSEFICNVAGSAERQKQNALPAEPIEVLHHARLQMVRQLPPAQVIIDLGGGCKDHKAGSLVAMGYPYPFQSITIVEAPREQRHEIYKDVCEEKMPDVDTGRGVVKYLLRSMADLAPIPDNSVDLVFSGESIEHVTRADAERVLSEAWRVLKPGGNLCFDTPNRIVTRIHVGDGYINPDHKWEYTHEELVEMLHRRRFQIQDVKGIAWMPETVRTGKFDVSEWFRHPGVYADFEKCYLIYYHCRKPA